MPTADLFLDPNVGFPHSTVPDKPCSQWLLGTRKAVFLPVISVCPLGKDIVGNFSSTQILRISVVRLSGPDVDGVPLDEVGGLTLSGWLILVVNLRGSRAVLLSLPNAETL